jgi:anti-sigma-K factor RskA
MSVHEQFGEDLALYVMGCLASDEKASLEKHLSECASCRRELEQLRGAVALLALTASGPAPPLRARTRFMDAVAEESRASSNPAPAVRSDRGGSRLPWWVSLGWIAAAGLIGIVAVLWIQNSRLRQNAVQLTRFAEQQRITADQSHRLDEILNARDAQRIELLPINHKIATPAGKAIYSRERGGLIFVASNLNPLPPQKAYELWLIPTQGAPIPAGVFKPDARGGAMVINPPLPARVEAKAFAITIEPEQGSTTPTMPIVMIGSGT